MKDDSQNDLQTIPGVGKSIARDLMGLGIFAVKDLKGKDPEKLYEESNALAGEKLDRCLLYVFREAVYFAETKNPEAELLKWWNWKDEGGYAKKRIKGYNQKVKKDKASDNNL